MSLFDALLLDPSPFESFIAYRMDSVGGSGTLNDPWNAATKWAMPLVLNTLSNSGSVATATLASGTFSTGE